MSYYKLTLTAVALLIFQLTNSVSAKQSLCPDICHPVSHGGYAIANKECGIVPKTICEIRNCTLVNDDGDVLQGFKCGCARCPDQCETRVKPIKKLMRRCRRRPYQNFCTSIPCIGKTGKPGVECGCPKKYLDCPHTCRLGRIGKILAILECNTKPVCAASGVPCTVQSCMVGTRTGKMCACAPEQCPNSCYTDTALMPQAVEECKVPRLCPHTGECKLRRCFSMGRSGRGCACEDPKPCPHICHTEDNGKTLAIEECNANVLCALTDKPCIVDRCSENHLPGYICRCRELPAV